MREVALLPVFLSTSATYNYHPKATWSSWFLVPWDKRTEIQDSCGDQTTFPKAASPVPSFCRFRALQREVPVLRGLPCPSPLQQEH